MAFNESQIAAQIELKRSINASFHSFKRDKELGITRITLSNGGNRSDQRSHEKSLKDLAVATGFTIIQESNEINNSQEPQINTRRRNFLSNLHDVFLNDASFKQLESVEIPVNKEENKGTSKFAQYLREDSLKNPQIPKSNTDSENDKGDANQHGPIKKPTSKFIEAVLAADKKNSEEYERMKGTCKTWEEELVQRHNNNEQIRLQQEQMRISQEPNGLYKGGPKR